MSDPTVTQLLCNTSPLTRSLVRRELKFLTRAHGTPHHSSPLRPSHRFSPRMEAYEWSLILQVRAFVVNAAADACWRARKGCHAFSVDIRTTARGSSP